MDQVRIGIIGGKFAARFHADCFSRNPGVKVVAIASPSGPDVLAKEWDIPYVYRDYNDLLARDDIHAVSICTPNFHHREAAIAAARAGKHVICEKPLATSSADAREIIAACEGAGVKLFYAEDWIFAPSLMRAGDIIAEGAIGEVLYVKAREVHNGSHSPYAKKKETCGGGSLIHLGIHPIGYMLYLLGGKDNPVVKVSGHTTGGLGGNYVHKDFEGEDWSLGVLTFADGENALIEGNYITVGGMDDVVEVYGTEGRLTVDITFGSNINVYSRGGYGYAMEKTDFTHGWTRPSVDEFLALGYVRELNYFVDCIRSGEPPKFGVDGAAGLACVEIVEALYRSAEEGRVVAGKW